jgi:hypothetical protein
VVRGGRDRFGVVRGQCWGDGGGDVIVIVGGVDLRGECGH